MLGFTIAQDLDVLCLGAHPDDIEIGCGGTLLALAATHDIRLTNLVLTASADREPEARNAAELFVPGSEVQVHHLPDGRLPAHWNDVKEILEGAARELQPDLIFAPREGDAHQDHRTVAELVTTVWRDSLVLRYEIPKWDGDRARPTHYVPLSPDLARRKLELLDTAYPSQQARDWWDEEMFLGQLRLRGMECRSRYAEAFEVDKAVVSL